MSGHLVTTKWKHHYYPWCLSRWELNRSVRLPFCFLFTEFVCCLCEAITEASRRLSIMGLKEKQQERIEAFVSGKDTFVSLPTEYGKSRWAFLCLPIFLLSCL